MRMLIRSFLRILQVGVVVWRYFLIAFLLPWRNRALSGPARVRAALEALGGTWIKLGQALALRFDLLPAAYCYELFKLLNEVKPFPYGQVREIIKQDLGDYPERLFRSFEPESFAAASIGQVHRAVLPTGEKVAVKVQRPNIRQVVRTDIKLMYFVAAILDYTHLLGATHNREVVREFTRWTSEELNYIVEARHAHNLRENARGDPLEKDAKVYLKYTSSRVLTTELIEGIPIIEIMYALRDGNTAYLSDLKARGYDLYRIARHICWNVLNQVYQHGYFHADLHPANLFVLSNDAIGYVDFGIIGKLSTELRESLVHYAWYLFQGDVDRAIDQFMRWVTPSERTDVTAAREELLRIMEDYLFTLRDPEHHSAKGAASAFEMDIMTLIRRYDMVLSPSVVAYMKAIITADAVMYELAPDFDLQWHENHFFGRMIMQEARSILDPHQAMQSLFDYKFRLHRVFDTLESVGQTGQAVESIVRKVRRRVQILGTLALVTAMGLYVVLAYPARRPLAEFSRVLADWLPIFLLVVFILLILGIIYHGRQLPAERAPGFDERQALRRRWERPRA